MKQTYQFWFFSFIEFHDGFLIQILYFKLSKQKKNNNKICIHILSAKPNPSNRLKAIMSNQNVNNPIKISFFLSLSPSSKRPNFISQNVNYYSKANKTFTHVNLCTKAIDDIIIIFLSLNIFVRDGERWWCKYFFAERRAAHRLRLTEKPKTK